MAEPVDEGIAYLRALRHTGPQGAAAAPAPETVSGAAVGSQPASAGFAAEKRYEGAEKRRSVRYKCEGGAEMRAMNCDVHTWATFTDISMHGCYVEAQATYPVGTSLHMKMQTNGFKVEVMGSVRVNYPYLGMGIAFVEMSAENRELLKQLLASIIRPRIIVGPGMASALPAFSALEGVPEISDPQAAVRALIEFFTSRQMLSREDFMRVIRTSQPAHLKP